MTAPITHTNCLGIKFSNYTHTHICYTKEMFPNYLCNHFRPHSNGTFPCCDKGFSEQGFSEELLSEGGFQKLSGTKTLRFIECERLRCTCVCILKTLRSKTLRFGGTKVKRPMRFGEPRANRSVSSCDLCLNCDCYHEGQACDLGNCAAKIGA